QEAAQRRKRRIRERFVGRRQRVLVEQVSTTPEGPVATGLSEYYHPVRISTDPDTVQANTFYDVEVTALGSGEDPPLIARLLAV
ncbi:MAG TPA: hypothetical protein VJ932_00800, partial [Alkalispirochaeta sp.]|nr:hypothetical protein [Alkalispirochaeta sp.]